MTRQYLVIGSEEQKMKWEQIVNERLEFLRDNLPPEKAGVVDWEDLAHQVREDTAKRLGITLKW